MKPEPTYLERMDDFRQRYAELRTRSYDCVDRIVLNAYHPLGHKPGGFRAWWRRWHHDNDYCLDPQDHINVGPDEDRQPGRHHRSVRKHRHRCSSPEHDHHRS
jgi:hypothetical protein